MVRVKICGITNLEDALHASSQGADALGFVFFKGSPRFIEPEQAGEITRLLPPFITTVGVFVNPGELEVRAALDASGVRVLQFHGTESPAFCDSFGVPYVKSLRVRNMASLKELSGYSGAAAYLLDAYSEAEFGGTGLTFNWDVAVEAGKMGRVILAGGLTQYNVANAVEHVRPYAVDVSSGVEATKGKKDHEAVRNFIAEAKGLLQV
jgi:phosphoribosylanthranilate isomerase